MKSENHNLKIKFMMFKANFLSVALFAVSIGAFAQNNCRDLRGCERKLCELNTKLTYAKKYNNQNQIRGLEIAIEKTKTYCTTNSANYDLDKKVKDKREKVEDRTEELNKAIRKQESAEKIAKKRRKLAEANAELNEAILAQKGK